MFCFWDKKKSVHLSFSWTIHPYTTSKVWALATSWMGIQLYLPQPSTQGVRLCSASASRGTLWLQLVSISPRNLMIRKKRTKSIPNSCLNEWLADNATNTYLEDIALDPESRMLYLTSKTEGSLMRVEAKEGAKLELFLTNKASRPTGITIDPCSRSLDFIEE